jgi:hypothetical protein
MCLVCIYSNSKDLFVQYLNEFDEILLIRIFLMMQPALRILVSSCINSTKLIYFTLIILLIHFRIST